jgi:hypothetical protein
VKRAKQLTKKERKALKGPRPAAQGHDHQHIHCIACGRHLDPAEFEPAATHDGAASGPKPRAAYGGATATILRCAHGSQFPSCTDCASRSQELLDTHDRTGQPVQQAAAWH